MHNRDMIWVTKEGEKIKIKDIPSAHLSNILPFINSHIDAFKLKFGEKKLKKVKHNILQELRYRKLNRIKARNEENKLF